MSGAQHMPPPGTPAAAGAGDAPFGAPGGAGNPQFGAPGGDDAPSGVRPPAGQRAGGLFSRLPAWARPLDADDRVGRGRRRVELWALGLIAAVLLVATVNDLVLQVHTNHRLVKDLATWRAATGLYWNNLGIERDVTRFTNKDTICGNVATGPPDERAQVCLTMTGPVVHGHRYVTGGYYLPPIMLDIAENRYSCFGEPAREHLCGMAHPPPGVPPSPPIKLGRP